MALEAARFQMSRKEDSWLKFRELYRSSHEGLGLDTESLKKGFMAGFVRGQLTESRSDAYEKGEAQPAGHSSSDGSRSGDSFSEWVDLYGDSHQRDALDGVALKKGFMAGFGSRWPARRGTEALTTLAAALRETSCRW